MNNHTHINFHTNIQARDKAAKITSIINPAIFIFPVADHGLFTCKTYCTFFFRH